MKVEWYVQGILLSLLCFTSLEDLKSHSIRLEYPLACLLGSLVRQWIVRGLSWQMFLGGMAFGVAFMVLGHFYNDMLGAGDGLILCVCGGYLGLAQVAMLFARAIFLAAMWGVLWLGSQFVRTGRFQKQEMAFLPFVLLAYGSLLIE